MIRGRKLAVIVVLWLVVVYVLASVFASWGWTRWL